MIKEIPTLSHFTMMKEKVLAEITMYEPGNYTRNYTKEAKHMSMPGTIRNNGIHLW